MKPEPFVILLAEDDEGHATLVQRNLARAGLINPIVHVQDGQEALDYLDCQNQFADRPVNGSMLLVLDINMPRIDGVEVLRRVKSHERHGHLPVIMLTTTDDPREIERCYELGCSVYITKPVESAAFVEAIRRLGLLIQVVSMPRELE